MPRALGRMEDRTQAKGGEDEEVAVPSGFSRLLLPSDAFPLHVCSGTKSSLEFRSAEEKRRTLLVQLWKGTALIGTSSRVREVAAS